ncbi:hypothetical protein Dimus_003260 [Dionaea muscipula]
MVVTHLKKRDVVKSSVKGVAIEFDHDKLASILGVPGKNKICEYIKDVWEESKYTKPLEITRRFANDETLMAARRVDEVATEGESGSSEKFYDAEDEVQGSPEVNDELPTVVTQASAQQKEPGSSGSIWSSSRSCDEQVTSRV